MHTILLVSSSLCVCDNFFIVKRNEPKATHYTNFQLSLLLSILPVVKINSKSKTLHINITDAIKCKMFTIKRKDLSHYKKQWPKQTILHVLIDTTEKIKKQMILYTQK